MISVRHPPYSYNPELYWYIYIHASCYKKEIGDWCENVDDSIIAIFTDYYRIQFSAEEDVIAFKLKFESCMHV